MPSPSSTVAPPTSRREAKKLATASALRDAAFALVAERGLRGVTVDDIAEAADVSPRTFFNYFPSKEAVLLGGVLGSDDLAEMLRAQPAAVPPVAALVAALISRARAIEKDADELDDAPASTLARMTMIRSEPELLTAFVSEMAKSELRAAAALAERAGHPPDDLAAAVVTAAALATCRVALMRWAQSGGETVLAELTEEALSLLGQELANRPAPTSRPARRSTRRLLEEQRP